MGETSTVIQIELWEIVALGAALLIAFFGAVWAFGSVLMSQFEKRLDERFVSLEQARQEAQKHWDERFARIENQWRESDREIQKFRLKVAEEYWRREDAMREQVTLHTKIDSLALKIENWTLRRQMGHEQP